MPPKERKLLPVLEVALEMYARDFNSYLCICMILMPPDFGLSTRTDTALSSLSGVGDKAAESIVKPGSRESLFQWRICSCGVEYPVLLSISSSRAGVWTHCLKPASSACSVNWNSCINKSGCVILLMEFMGICSTR